MEHIDSNTLWHYLAGDATTEQTGQIKKHLSSCEDCTREFELLRQVEATLHLVDEDVTSFGFSDAVIRKIQNEVALEYKSKFPVNFLPYTILGGIALAILTTIIMGAGLDIDITQVEGILNSQVGVLTLTACSLLWGFYFVDRIFKKIFVPLDYAQSR